MLGVGNYIRQRDWETLPQVSSLARPQGVLSGERCWLGLLSLVCSSAKIPARGDFHCTSPVSTPSCGRLHKSLSPRNWEAPCRAVRSAGLGTRIDRHSSGFREQETEATGLSLTTDKQWSDCPHCLLLGRKPGAWELS